MTAGWSVPIAVPFRVELVFQAWIPKSLATSIRVKWGFPATNHRYQREKPSKCHASPDAPDLPEEMRNVFDLPLDRRGSARSRSSFELGLRRPGNR